MKHPESYTKTVTEARRPPGRISVPNISMPASGMRGAYEVAFSAPAHKQLAPHIGHDPTLLGLVPGLRSPSAARQPQPLAPRAAPAETQQPAHVAKTPMHLPPVDPTPLSAGRRPSWSAPLARTPAPTNRAKRAAPLLDFARLPKAPR